MKKITKISAVIVALVALCAALVIVGAADATPASDKNWVVAGVAGEDGLGGFDTLEGAVAAANGKKITLNKDVTLNAINVTSEVRLDMGCHTVTTSAGTLFNVKNGGSFTLTGEGTFVGVATLCNVEGGAKLSLDGYGNGISVKQKSTTNPVIALLANSETKMSGSFTFSPKELGTTRVFSVGTKGTSFENAAKLTLDAARVVITEPYDGSHLVDKSGMTFAYVNDGANVVIVDSTVTMEHGHFMMAGAFNHNAFVEATGSNGQVTAVTGTVPDFTAKIDIDDSKISAYNSGYSKILGTWGNSSSAGTLFGIGWNPVEIRVDNTDLVGTNRSFGTGNAARGVYKLSPTYYYFTNVNFTGADFSTYTSNWMIQEHVNMKWDGGAIDLKNGVAKVAFNLSGSDVASDPYGATAIAAAKAAGYIKNDEEIWNYYFCANPQSGLGWGSVTNCYVSFSTYGYNILAQNGTYYNGNLESAPAGWSGILFSNCYFATAPANTAWKDGAQGVVFNLGGTKYESVGIFEGGNVKTYPVAYLDKAPDVTTLVSNRTSTLNDGNGCTITKGTKVGTAKYGGNNTIFETTINSGKYEETTAGYVKLSVDKDTETTKNHYIGLWYFSASADTAHKNENGTFVVSEFDIATDTGAFNAGTWALQSRFTKHTWKLNEAGTAIVDGGQLANPSNNSKFRLSNNDYNAFYLNADGTLDLSKKYTTYAKDANGNDITSVKLKTDGTWARISIVYEMIAEKVTYKPVEGSDLEKEAWDFSKSKAHLYIDGVWAATKEGIFVNKTTPWQTGVETDSHVDVEQADTFNLDSLRFSYNNNYPTNGTAATCIDNVRLSYYTPSNAAKAEGITAIKNNGASAVSLADYKNDFLIMEKNAPIGGSAFGTVDGVDYYSEADLVAAIKNGSYVELNGDVESVLLAGDMKFAVKLNGHSFAGVSSATNKLVTTGDIINVTTAHADEIFDALVQDEGFGVNETVKAALGTIPYYTGLVPGERVASGGAFRTFISWQNANGGSTVLAELAKDGKIAFTAKTTDTRYYYTITTNGKIEYFTDDDDGSEIVSKLNATAANDTVVLVLWCDVLDTSNASITPKQGQKLYVDVNGYEFTFARTNGKKESAINASNAGTEFYLLSSRAGGVFANLAGYYQNADARTLGGVIWNTSNNAIKTPSTATFGTVKNAELGIDAKGDNLTVLGAALADVNGVNINNINSNYTDKDGDGIVDYAGYTKINVDGGCYVRITNDTMGLIIARAQVEVNVKNATLCGAGPIFSCDHRYWEPVMKLNVDGSKIVLMTDDLSGFNASGSFFGLFYLGSHAEITNTTVCGGWSFGGNLGNYFTQNNANWGNHDAAYQAERNANARRGTVTLGEGVALTSIPTNDNVEFAAGLVLANAKYTEAMKTLVPSLEYVYTTANGETKLTLADCAGGSKALGATVTAARLTAHSFGSADFELPVVARVGKADDFAKLVWYDTDRESVLKVTYNALLGDTVVDEGLQREVEPIYGNEWYDLTFTRWELPEQLAAGVEFAIYPVCETPTASVKCLKTNLTVYTYFRLNFYLPAETEERVVLQGIFEDAEGERPLTGELVTVDGVQYLRYSVYPGAANPKEETRYIVYTVDGNRFVQAFDYGIPTYAETVMKNDDGLFDKEQVALVSNMVRYANACYKLIAGTTSTRYDELLANYGDGLIAYEDIAFSAEELAVDYSKIGRYIESASFLFGSYQPRFAFKYNAEALRTAKLPKDADGDIGSWPRGNRGVFSHIYYNDYENFSSDHLADHVVYDESGNDVTSSFVGANSFAGADSVWAMSNNVFVYDMTEIMNVVVYAPDGTVVRGTYSLAVYIQSLAEGSDAYNAAMALYAYSLVAQEYAPVGLIDG